MKGVSYLLFFTLVDMNITTDKFNYHLVTSNIGCSALLEKLSFADMLQFAGYGRKLSLNKAMDDINEHRLRNPEYELLI